MPDTGKIKNQIILYVILNIINALAIIELPQWFVVEGFQRCNIKILFWQTRLPSPDSQLLHALHL